MKNYITLFGILFLFIISIVVATECQDSDGDDTGHIKGSCSSPYDVTQTDFCDSESRVVEFYCDSQEDRCMATTYNCEEGYCYDGICVTQSEYDRLKNEEETRGFVKEICTENDETVERSDLINRMCFKI